MMSLTTPVTQLSAEKAFWAPALARSASTLPSAAMSASYQRVEVAGRAEVAELPIQRCESVKHGVANALELVGGGVVGQAVHGVLPDVGGPVGGGYVGEVLLDDPALRQGWCGRETDGQAERREALNSLRLVLMAVLVLLS